MISLDSLLTEIRGITAGNIKKLERLHIQTLRDLITCFPRRYEDRTMYKKIMELLPGESACVIATVTAIPSVTVVRDGLVLIKVRVRDESGQMEITFFNQIWLRKKLLPNNVYVFYGRVEEQGLFRTMTAPVVEAQNVRQFTGRIVPIYPLTAGFSQAQMSRCIRLALNACRENENILPDALPESVRTEKNLCPVQYAYENIHFPESVEALRAARERLAFEELFFFALGLRKLRRTRDAVSISPCKSLDIQEFHDVLPFALTNAQVNCIRDILQDMASGKAMSRLCQGDVGSGKTIVAAAGVYFCVKSGQQAALMAPTEILAQQHYTGLEKLMSRLGIRCALLSHSVTTRDRRIILENLALGEIDFLIGTHALLSDNVIWRDLGLVVTDEQHRFGVAQRAALAAKGRHPHTLVMSATPIPRTLALILYKDLDVSIIDELPPGRKPVETYAVPNSYHPRVYNFIRKLVGEGRQAYIVCPMVTAAETTVTGREIITGEIPDGNISNMSGEKAPDEKKAVTEYAGRLQKEIFPDLRVAYVHGRMKAKEKDEIMNAFAAGQIDVLVATTVIEVGVDVPNAALMIVENAERFGLSQLHQLRGRVGRGAHQSYCILLSDSRTKETWQRLKTMTQTTDGFKIAEEDLRLRGPGEFFGQRQHGLPGLKIADLGCDTKLLQEAQNAADMYLTHDPELLQCPATAEQVEYLFAGAADTLN